MLAMSVVAMSSAAHAALVTEGRPNSAVPAARLRARAELPLLQHADFLDCFACRHVPLRVSVQLWERPAAVARWTCRQALAGAAVHRGVWVEDTEKSAQRQ